MNDSNSFAAALAPKSARHAEVKAPPPPAVVRPRGSGPHDAQNAARMTKNPSALGSPRDMASRRFIECSLLTNSVRRHIKRVPPESRPLDRQRAHHRSAPDGAAAQHARDDPAVPAHRRVAPVAERALQAAARETL